MFSITVFVPVTHAAAVRAALALSGAGALGLYDSCSFSSVGVGRFRPLQGANPAIGRVGAVEEVAEERVETVVTGLRLPAVLEAVVAAHPYEEPAIFVHAMLDYKAFLAPGAGKAGPAGVAASQGPRGFDC